MTAKSDSPSLEYDEVGTQVSIYPFNCGVQVLDHIGQFGRAQWNIFFLLSLVSATSGLAVVVFAFTGLLIVWR